MRREPLNWQRPALFSIGLIQLVITWLFIAAKASEGDKARRCEGVADVVQVLIDN